MRELFDETKRALVEVYLNCRDHSDSDRDRILAGEVFTFNLGGFEVWVVERDRKITIQEGHDPDFTFRTIAEQRQKMEFMERVMNFAACYQEVCDYRLKDR